MAKKAAMENLLKTQQSLEEVEESIATYLPKETIEVAHARFLSTIGASDPEALYLFAVGRPAIRPLSSRLEPSRITIVNRGFSCIVTSVNKCWFFHTCRDA